MVNLVLDAASDTGASHTDGLTNVTTPTFDVTVNKPGSIELDVDGTAVKTQPVAAAGIVPITLTTALADGQHAIKAIFTPSTGTAVQDSITVTIDTTHPTVVAGAATEQAPLFGRALTFSKAIDPATLTASTVTLVGPGSTTIPVSGLTGSGTTYTLGFNPPLTTAGSYTVNVGAGVADLAGNLLATPTSDAFTLNSVSPTVILALDPASDSGASHNDGLTNITTPTFNVTVNEAGSIELDVDGTAVKTQPATGAGTVPIALTTALADGQHAIKAIFTPGFGSAVQAGITVTIDTTSPQIVAATPSGNISAVVDHVDVTFSEPINASTFTASVVTLTGPGGTITVGNPSQVSGNTYRIPFAASRPSGRIRWSSRRRSPTLPATPYRVRSRTRSRSSFPTWSPTRSRPRIPPSAPRSPSRTPSTTPATSPHQRLGRSDLSVRLRHARCQCHPPGNRATHCIPGGRLAFQRSDHGDAAAPAGLGSRDVSSVRGRRRDESGRRGERVE